MKMAATAHRRPAAGFNALFTVVPELTAGRRESIPPDVAVQDRVAF
jgi:hypothetical protein